MFDLGKYTGAILSSWFITIIMLLLLVLVTWRASVKAKIELNAAEERRDNG